MTWQIGTPIPQVSWQSARRPNGRMIKPNAWYRLECTIRRVHFSFDDRSPSWVSLCCLREFCVHCPQVIDLTSVSQYRRHPMVLLSCGESALWASSDLLAVVGEAFRPVAHPMLVTAAYAVSWTYLAGDVAYETFKAKRRGPSPTEALTYSEPTRLAMAAVQRSVFQSVASM